jgi:hypothetical protein
MNIPIHVDSRPPLFEVDQKELSWVVEKKGTTPMRQNTFGALSA